MCYMNTFALHILALTSKILKHYTYRNQHFFLDISKERVIRDRDGVLQREVEMEVRKTNLPSLQYVVLLYQKNKIPW